MSARNSDDHMFNSMSKMTATTGSEEAARNGGSLPHLAEMTVSKSAARHSFYPLTGMCMAIYGGTWRVTSRLGLGFGQEPDPVPETSLEQQSPQPVDAVADYAHLPFRLLPTVAMLSRQRFGPASKALAPNHRNPRSRPARTVSIDWLRRLLIKGRLWSRLWPLPEPWPDPKPNLEITRHVPS